MASESPCTLQPIQNCGHAANKSTYGAVNHSLQKLRSETHYESEHAAHRIDGR